VVAFAFFDFLGFFDSRREGTFPAMFLTPPTGAA
jgi:hypothetical protein